MSRKPLATHRINCHKCRHYFVTWEPGRPHGCKLMGFKSHRLPSEVVYQSSGAPCQAFEPNQYATLPKQRQT